MQGIADIVHDTRKRFGFTQQELADNANVSRRTIMKIESDQQGDMKLSSIESILASLGLRLAVIPTPPQHITATDESYSNAFNSVMNEYFNTAGD